MKGVPSVQRKYRLVAAVAIVVLGLGYLFWNGMHSFTEYYMTIPEVTAQETSLVGHPARVEGEIVGSSVHYTPATQKLTFTLQGGGKDVNIVYYGTRPDDFTGSVHAIVDGQLQSDGVFAAKRVLIKCPSHYKPKPVKSEKQLLGFSSLHL